MKVFVAGATGVVGWRTVERLVAAGHEVTGVARTGEKAALLRRLGATPVKVDLFDAAAVKDAVAGHDAVLNLATHIPSLTSAALPGAWSENDRIRNEASRNLVDGAIAAGASRYVQESICFPYPDRGDEWIDEDVPFDAPGFTRSVLEAERQAARFTESGGTGVVLRFGQFYGPDASHTRTLVQSARRRMFPVPGPSDAYTAAIQLDDAAAAVVAALDAPARAYNVVDDEPLTRREFSNQLGQAVGARPPRRLPAWFSRLGGAKTSLLARSQRVSNRRFKEATGWAPAYPSAREGWRAVVAGVPDDSPTGPWRLVRLLLGILAASSVLVGVWAEFFPRGFYDDFPGGGRHWVSADGPYNEHLIRDFGALNLALALVLIVAAVNLGPLLVRTAAAAALVYGLPHFVYHLRHLDVYDTGDQMANVLALALAVVGPALVLWLVRRPRHA
jgi:2-alkyl-3-oxoalkanoate reductase